MPPALPRKLQLLPQPRRNHCVNLLLHRAQWVGQHLVIPLPPNEVNAELARVYAELVRAPAIRPVAKDKFEQSPFTSFQSQ